MAAVTGNVVKVTGPGVFGGIRVSFDPFVRPPISIPLHPRISITEDFAAAENAIGNGNIITITFDKPVDYVELRADGSNAVGNKLIAYDVDGNKINEVEFARGSILSVPFAPSRTITIGTPSPTQAMQTKGIRKLEVVTSEKESQITFGGFKIRADEESVTTTPADPNTSGILIPLQIRLVARPTSRALTTQIFFDVTPAIPVLDREPDSTDTEIDVRGLPIEMERAIDDIARDITSGMIDSFFDPSRELKTVVNFGQDFQTLLTNWQRDTGNAFLVKLYKPLPVSVNTKELVWVSREVSPTWTDSIFVRITEEGEIIFFLRPPNKNTETTQLFGREVSGKTLDDLIPSGSVSISGSTVVLDNALMEQFFNTNILEGVELNIDYTDYNNFIQFSSAENRLIVFREKLLQIEAISSSLSLQSTAASASLVSGTINELSGTAQFTVMTELVEEQQNLVRGFDGYERFLYFDTGSFSGSLTGLTEDPLITLDDVTWPKDISGSVLAVSDSASLAYFTTQAGVGSDFDLSNQEALRNNIPLYLQNDEDSVEFLTFLNMIGHMFDTVKSYIDAMPSIYDRDPSPDRGLSKDLLWHIAESLGIKLPNQYSVKELVDFGTNTDSGSATQETYKQAIAETWKRFIHNQVFIAKSAGTATGIQSLLNIYGVAPELIRLRETTTPSSIFTTGSYEVFDELTNVLGFASGSSLTIPWDRTGIFSPTTIETRFAMALGTGSFTSSMIMHAQTSASLNWSVVLRPTGSAVNKRGELFLLDDTGALVASSSVDKFFNGEFYTLMLRQTQHNTGSVDFSIKRFEDDVFEYSFTAAVTTSLSGSFRSGEITLGASGTFADGTGSNDLRIDEFRLWREAITDETFCFHTQFPGMYGGNSVSSSKENLIFRHSFGIPQDLEATASVPNETPFISSGSVALILTGSVAVGFVTASTFPHQYVRITRQTKRFTPNAGGSQFSSAKIRIAPSASFNADALVTTGSVTFPVLSRFRSAVKSNVARKDDIKADTRIGLYFTLAETINDSILRSLGNVDLNDLIGDPQNIFNQSYTELIDLNKFYKRSLAPTFDQNEFIRSVEDLLDGLFSHVKQIIPVGTKLISGIVIEPPILERSKFRLNRPLVVGGAGTRNALSSSLILAASGSRPMPGNIDARVAMSQTSSISSDMTQLNGDIEDTTDIPFTALLTPLDANVADFTQSVTAEPSFVDALVLVDDAITPTGENLTHETSISLDTEISVISLLNLLNVTIFTTSSTIFTATVPTLETIVDANIVFTDIGAAIPGDFVIPEIKPANDLDDPRNAIFFTHPSGSIGLIGFQKTRVNDNRLNDRGAWVEGNTYVKNDVVILSESQFRSLSSQVAGPTGSVVIFVSHIPPNLDTKNWVPVSFIQSIVPRLFKAVVSGSSRIGTGSVALVPFDQPGGVFIGYAPNHYKFFRPTYTAYIRSRFSGVKQTIDTTIDGKSPIEILLSSDAQLFVKDGTPRQTATDEAGPILEVRPDITGSSG